MQTTARTSTFCSQPAQPDPSVIDLDHLRRYTMDSPELERELIGLFMNQLPSLRDQLRAAAVAPDWKMVTHTLKGSARVIGASTIGAVAAQLETEGLGGDANRRLKLIERLDAAIADFTRAASQLHP